MRSSEGNFQPSPSLWEAVDSWEVRCGVGWVDPGAAVVTNDQRCRVRGLVRCRITKLQPMSKGDQTLLTRSITINPTSLLILPSLLLWPLMLDPAAYSSRRRRSAASNTR